MNFERTMEFILSSLARSEARRAEKRLDRLEKQMLVTRSLVTKGIKFVAKQHKETRLEMREIRKALTRTEKVLHEFVGGSRNAGNRGRHRI